MPTIDHVIAKQPDIVKNLDAKYATCLKDIGHADAEDLVDYDGGGLMAVPLDAPTLATLLDEMTAQDGTIKKENAADKTAISRIMRAIKATLAADTPKATPSADTTAEKERKAADGFAQLSYADIEAALVTRVLAADRLEGAMVKKMSDDLDRGTLSVTCYRLTTLKGVLSAEDERKATLGGMSVQVTTEADVPTGRTGEVLLQIHRWSRGMLAAGMRAIKPDSRNPDAASKGELAVVTVPDESPGAAAGAEVPMRWHLTLACMDAYLVAALAASVTMGPKELLLAHIKLMELTVDLLHANFNFESALSAVLSRNSFHSALALLPSYSGTIATTPVRDSDAADSKELRDLRAANASLKKENSVLRNHQAADAQSLKRGRDDDDDEAPKGRRVCFDFQRGECTRGDKCRFVHKCELCGSTAHGSATCPTKRQ